MILFGFLGGAQAQEKYPSRPIELVIPYAAGGGGDIATRLFSDDWSKFLKTPITMVNRAGGAGVQGTTYVVKAKKDGYTLLSTPLSSILIQPVLSKEVTYDPLTDLTPLAHFNCSPALFAVRSDAPFKTLNELIKYARENPNKLTNCVGGLGTEAYFSFEILRSKNNIKIVTIPFSSGREALTSLLGGHVDLSTNSLSASTSFLKAGQIRGLAITSKTRNPDFPDIPTTAELGFPEVNFGVRTGVFAPSGLPQSVLNILVSSLEKVLKNPELVQRAAKASVEVEYMGPDEFRELIRSETRVVEKLARDLNMTRK
jgi:tripartite-type tricarboxylate transporter receptor subunit TctC